ncbi:toll-like receptor 4 [Mya arenaria]|uniref:toll-like receptor 4 n=1 Tax=Mya arenaria TaxID=6604 RepID=UPI0022E00569|nr:toll-like receptor 4 [Mya arenaria]
MNIEFDENYRNTNLSTLVMSSMIGQCGIVSLSNKTFRGLPKLRQLTMTGCKISQITENIFSSVPLLAYLDISNNFKLGLYNAIGPLAKSLNPFNIKTLKMNFVSNPDDIGTKLTKENLKYVNAMSLAHLEMDSNNIEIFEYSALNMSRGKLKTLSMQNNNLFFSLFVATIVWDNPSLVEIDLRDQFKYKNPAPEVYTKLTLSDDQFKNKLLTHDVTNASYNEPLLSRDQENAVSLKKFSYTGSRYFIDPLDFYNTSNSLWYMDISENRITWLKKYDFENLNHLTFLNLSNNYIEKVDSNSFEDLVALKYFYLQNNLLGFEMGFGNLDNIFKPLLSLEHLILARNRIYAIKKDMFSSCKQLQFLDLSDNYLNELDIDVSQLQNIYLLNLRTNRIQSFPLAVQKGLDTIINHTSLTVNLVDNKLVCSCGNLNFLKWILSSNISFIERASYKCTFINSTSVFIRSEFISDLEMECHRYLTVIITCTALASLFLATITAAIGYRYRWHILYWYYMAKLKDRAQGGQQNIYERLFEWDAYISYDDEDLHFVAAKMQPELEERLHYKLHIRERDFVLGETNSLNILNAVQQSKRTLLIISRHFLKNKWCNFEINMAMIEGIKSERGVLILVFLEKIPAAFMPRELAALLKQCPVVDWPQCEDVAEAFWDKLVNYINDYNDISEN